MWSLEMVLRMSKGGIIVQAMATVTVGSVEGVLRGKVMESVAQLMTSFVEKSHGRPRTIVTKGCSFMMSSEMSCEEESANVREVLRYS